ncbi:MAG: EAL domain-containing protein [Acidobacteria bacterium]|nr:EAL domain-containing protein [Acidobacteriota bacterium]NIM64013.1 EAL domain-containing protein [Acidobacteriota bacterium]NIO58483.1 EAL domain-containing protein [Acidobacteriota bacterium]NIQ29541.1 EAL domain-containing protein [Acidobacteriota bacterium]NIQ84233.1 EAL domain-containing protein [Acidobacteriota bacterium]
MNELETPIAERTQELSGVLDVLQRELIDRGQLGLLTVTVLSARAESTERWADYERVLDEISTFLVDFSKNRLRRSDVMLEPVLSGNTYVLLLGPPRDARVMDLKDVRLVRGRVVRELRHHLAQHLDPNLIERYGTYVGSSRIRHAPDADIERIVYRGIEEAQAEAMSQSRIDQRNQVANLTEILESQAITMVYQPLVDLTDRRVIGYEALTRLPGGQFQSPDIVFKVATDLGVLWSLERLCRKRALENLPPLDDGQRLFVNLEPDSFFDPWLRSPGFVEELADAGLEPTRVVLELTERAAVKDYVAMRKVLGEVRRLGYPLALDDVGSGYAGLQTIAEIRPDYLKMDMALIRNLHLDPIRRELVRTVGAFADNTGTTLVAEGVETVAELETLAGTGVRCAQGFLFARPNNPPEVPEWPELPDRS